MIPLKRCIGNGIEVRVYNVFNSGFSVVWHPINEGNYAKTKYFDKEQDAFDYVEEMMKNENK